jgi:predicted MFS family arabinose efflux permease
VTERVGRPLDRADILAVTPERETSSAMSVNKVVRSVAFSLGSAFGGLMLAAGTNTGHSSPVDGA